MHLVWSISSVGLRLGYQLAIYPATGFLAMGQALTKVYRSLSTEGQSSLKFARFDSKLEEKQLKSYLEATSSSLLMASKGIFSQIFS